MGARGEATLQVGEREVTLLFTNRAIADAEDKIGKGILEILVGFEQGRGSILDTAHLLRAGMEAARREARTAGRPVSLPQAFEVMDEVGFTEALSTVAIAIAAVLGYDTDADEAEDELDPNV